jgi:hypothetical protein
MNERPRTSPRTSHFLRGFYPVILDAGITELHSLQSLVSRLPGFLSDEQSEFERHLEKRVREEGMDKDQRSGFYENHEAEFHELHTFFPNAVWNSLLALACSLFEARLVEACKFLERSCAPLGDKWATVNGKGLEKSAVFLRKNFGIFPERHETWVTIRDFFGVRNCFVHANGDIDLMLKVNETEASANRLRNAGVTVLDTRMLQITDNAVATATKRMETWFKAFRIACRDNANIGPKFWP